MMTIDEYCDKAKKELGLKSDRELNKALNLASSNITNYRTRRAWPSPTTIVKLANFAKCDPEQAVLNLMIWKEENPDTRNIMTKILEKITNILAIMLVITGFCSTKCEAKPYFNIKNVTMVSEHQLSFNLYYGK